MGIVLIIAAVLAGLIALFFILALFAPKAYSIERSIVIDRPVTEVFGYIKYLKNQDHFNKWVRVDPAMKKAYRGIDGAAGFVYAWDGNKKAGAGEQEIKQIKDNERLELEVRFVRPFAGVAGTPFTTKAISDTQTNVTWSMHSSMKYPVNIMLLFMNMDKLLGKDMESSLTMLKEILEGR